MNPKSHLGRCECGAVAFSVAGALRAPTACHCRQCRRISGHVWAGTTVMTGDLTLLKVEGLRWFRSSETPERGFCANCGSSLFYRPIDGDHVSVAAGAFASPTGMRLHRHIFVADKGDYYDIADGLPQRDQ